VLEEAMAQWGVVAPEKKKVHYGVHKCRPTFPIVSQLDPVHILTSQFLKINLNIILPSTPGFLLL
jgi:hypothetical protein